MRQRAMPLYFDCVYFPDVFAIFIFDDMSLLPAAAAAPAHCIIAPP